MEEHTDELLGYLHDISSKLDGLDELGTVVATLGNIERKLDSIETLLLKTNRGLAAMYARATAPPPSDGPTG